MLVLRLWNYLRGYVIILIEGYFLEKFINICTHRQILLWDINRSSNSAMVLKVSIKGFKLLKPICKKTGCRIRILRKKGVPFILNRYRKRKTFILGALIFVLLFYILTSFIWAIEITGNKKVDTQLLLDKLASEGVKPGVLKYGIDIDKVVNDMMLEVKELAWIGVVVKGTKVKIEVVERVQPPPVVPKNEPCNIIAGRDGIIKSITAKAGQTLVKAGDTVTKGQVLISGVVRSLDESGKAREKEPPRYVHSLGTVKARTWYEHRCPVNVKQYEKERTGNKKDNYTLVLLNKKINLFHKAPLFDDYDEVEIKKKLSIGEDLTLPFEFIINRYYESIIVENELSLDDAKQLAADTAYSEVMKELADGTEIVKSGLNFTQDDSGQLNAVVTVECIEDIGITERIGGN